MITKEAVVWHNEDEYIVMEENGWRIALFANHFKNEFWYEIITPEDYYLPEIFTNIFDAIEEVEKKKKQ